MGELYEIGGADRVTYLELMQEYARAAWPAPDDDPRPGAHAAALEPLALARHAGLRRRRPEAGRLAAERDRRAGRLARSRSFGVRPRAACARRSPARSPRGPRDRRDALVGRGVRREPTPYGGVRRGSRLVDSRSIAVAVPGRRRRSRRSSGSAASTGWYKGAAALAAARAARRPRWEGRGCGADGVTRSGSDVGDTLDFWRVEAFEPDRLLRLQRGDEGARPRVAPVRGRARRGRTARS